MITVQFFEGKKGVEVSGHSGYGEEGSDIVCASVSSAVYMAANTISDVIGVDINVKIDDGFMDLKISKTSKETDILIDGLELHLSQLALQFPQYIVITKT